MITKRQISLFGHICRKEKLDFLFSAGSLKEREPVAGKDKVMLLA